MGGGEEGSCVLSCTFLLCLSMCQCDHLVEEEGTSDLHYENKKFSNI